MIEQRIESKRPLTLADEQKKSVFLVQKLNEIDSIFRSIYDAKAERCLSKAGLRLFWFADLCASQARHEVEQIVASHDYYRESFPELYKRQLENGGEA